MALFYIPKADLPYSMSYVPPPNKQLYYEQVWSLVRQIPVGRVATYGRITKILPQPDGISAEDFKLSASRWVGLAMAACPDNVPWQRVINSQGKISHSDPGKQKKLLEEEGVFCSKDKIDLNEYEWLGPGHKGEPRQSQLF